MKYKILLSLIAALAAGAIAFSQQRLEWNNPLVIQQNKEKPHATSG